MAKIAVDFPLDSAEINGTPVKRFLPKKVTDLSGRTIGRWLVTNEYQLNDRGERKWLCKCQCGTEKYVLERTLKAGKSQSCGCLRREKVKSSLSHKLDGKIFGDLTVLGLGEANDKRTGTIWRCRCTCGKEVAVLATLLVNGKKTHCGCNTIKKQPIADIRDEKFGRLTAIFPTQKRDSKGYVIWHCKCDCGKELDVSYNALLYSKMRSCGCQKKEHDQAMPSLLNHIDGTSLDMLKSKKVPVNNTTGHRGVYFIKGKYVAKIVFQKRAFYLGSYENIEDAIEARKEAEEAIFTCAVPFYEAWTAKAKEDPKWAEANPASVKVRKDNGGRLYLETLPKL